MVFLNSPWSVLLVICHLAACTVPEAGSVSYLLLEEQPGGTYVGNPAQDSNIYENFPDSTIFRFSLSAGAQYENLFSINQQTSALTTNSRIDREVLCPSHSPTCDIEVEVSVEISDQDEDLNPIPVKITVTDINDNPPVFAQSAASPLHVIVQENTHYTDVIGVIEAHDEDVGQNRMISFFLSERSSAEVKQLFQVDEDSGGIYLTQELDYETASVFMLMVEARDHGIPSLSTRNLVIVLVTDENDNRPIITVNTLTEPVTLSEAAAVGTEVAVVTCHDADSDENGNCTCSAQDAIFEMVGDGLYKIRLTGQLDREESSEHDVIILCFDRGEPSLTSTATLTVHVYADTPEIS